MKIVNRNDCARNICELEEGDFCMYGNRLLRLRSRNSHNMPDDVSVYVMDERLTWEERIPKDTVVTPVEVEMFHRPRQYRMTPFETATAPV